MARFQVSQVALKDSEAQNEIRKVNNELISKLNILAQSFSAYATQIAIAFTTQSLTATTAIIGSLTVTTINGLTLSGGSYTPTGANLTNVTTLTPSLLTWSREGNSVVVGGAFTATLTAVGVATSFSFDLPVASNFSGTTQAGGVAYNATNQALWSVRSDGTLDKVVFESFGICPTVSIQYQFTFTYLVQ